MATLTFDIRTRTGKFQQGMNTVSKRLGGVQRQTRMLTGEMRAMLGVASAAGFGFLIKGSIDAQAELFDLQQRLGITTEAMSRLQYAAEQTGVSTRTFNMGLQRMVRRVSEAASGTGEAVKALDELGLSAIRLEQMRPEQAFAVLSDAIMKVENPADRVRLAMKLFDSEGVALIQTMSAGSQGLQQFAEESDRLGRTVLPEQAAQAKAAADAMFRISGAGTGIANTLAIQLAPQLEETANWLASVIPQSTVAVRKAFNLLAAGALRITQGFVDARVAWNEFTGDTAEAESLRQISENLQGAQDVIFEQVAALEAGAGAMRQYAADTDVARYSLENFERAKMAAGGSNADNTLEEFDLEKIRKLKKDKEDVEQSHINRILQINVSGNEKLSRAMRAAEAVKALIHARSAITMAWASAPFPANLPAVAITTAETMANVAAIKGAAHGGLTNVPAESTYLLQKGERVLSPNQNKDFTSMMRNGGAGGGKTEVHNHYSVSVSAMDAASFDEYLMSNRGSIASALNAQREDRGEAPL